MCDTKLGGMAEKGQGKATIHKDWRNGNGPQAVQQEQTPCPVLRAEDVIAGC